MSYRAEIVEMLRKMPSGWRRQYAVGQATLARNGGPVLPNAPTPEQAMLILGNTAGGNVDVETPRGDQPVPKAVRDAAMKGLRLSYKNNYGGSEFFGIARAIQLALVPSVPMRARERMVRYLNDHEKDKAGTDFGNDRTPSRGYMAWLNWGGDPAKAWNERDGIKRATYGASARRTNGATSAAVKLGAKVGLKGGGKFIPVVGEALMAYDVAREGRNLYRRRKAGEQVGWTEGGVRLASSAIIGPEGVEWAKKKLDARKAKKNPALRDTGTLALKVKYDDFENGYRFVLYDTKKLRTPDLALVGYALAVDSPPASEAVQAVAQRGYGPMLYTLVASYLRSDVVPSKSHSKAADAFWSKQPGRRVRPLTEAELIEKFGVSLSELKRRDIAKGSHFRYMRSLGEDTALDAAKVEARGGTPELPRDVMLRASSKKNPGSTSAVRTDPELWEAVKAEVTRGSRGGLPGQWSARKAQMSVALYQDRGGGYVGPKSPRNSLAKWTREQWRTKSGRPSLETGERYLPAAAIAALTPAEYAATSRAKRAGMRKGEQFVPQPERIAEKVKRYRRNPWEIE
jgi:hypothetical protein